MSTRILYTLLWFIMVVLPLLSHKVVISMYHRSGYFIFTDLVKSCIMKQFTFFLIFTGGGGGGEGFQLGNAFEFVGKVFIIECGVLNDYSVSYNSYVASYKNFIRDLH